MMQPTWQTDDGRIRLFNADCLEVLPELEPRSIDSGMITDPPFFQPASHYCGKRGEETPIRITADLSILEHFFKSFISASVRLLSPSASAYVFCDGQSYHMAFLGLYPHMKYVRPLIWDKLISYNGYTWRHQHELIAWGEGHKAARVPTGDGDILKCRAVPVDDRKHPAEKPVELVERLVSKLPAGTVIDPFMGSATTAAACLRTGRAFIGIEKDPEYFKLAVFRIQAELAQPMLPGLEPERPAEQQLSLVDT